MELKALEALIAVARTSSFSRAADVLCVTQPTVSKLIQQLEQGLGHALLDRNSRQVKVTEAGELVLAHAQAIFQNMDSMRQGLDELNGLMRGTLRIGVTPLSPSLFVPLLSAFKLRYPQIELQLFEDGSKGIEKSLLNRDLDFGGLLSPVCAQTFHHQRMIDDRLALVSPRHSCWRKQSDVRLSDLSEEPFILFSESYTLNQHILDACSSQGFSPQVVGRSGQISLILEMVHSGIGIALLPSTTLSRLDTSLVSVANLIEPALPWRTDMVWLKGSPDTPVKRKWLELFFAHYPPGATPPAHHTF